MNINFSNHFQALADKFPDQEALLNVERDRRYSYAEFHKLTNRIVNMMMTDLGLGEGDCFINILDNDNMSLLHFPTIFKGPATGCFANYRDSLEEHIAYVDYVAPKVTFLENELLDSHYAPLRERGVEIVCMDPLEERREGVRQFWELVDAASADNPNVELDDREHISLIRFTGGTTGKGKAAKYCIDNWLGHRDTMHALPDRDWTTDARMLHIAPISHGSGMLFVPTFYNGGCNVTLNEPDLNLYCLTIEKEGVTHSFLVPTILYRLLELSEELGADLSSLRNMYYGAAPMSPAKLTQLQAAFGNIFIQLYGSTEHFGIALSLSKAEHVISDDADSGRLSSAGRPTGGVEVVIADDHGVPVPKGEMGELWLRSRATIPGYYNNPEQTEAEFENGYWKSGDMGYMDEGGFVYIVDRKKDMIISGGFNVYATEVEAAVNAHEAVIMSAVIGKPHEEWGEAVHAEVMLREGAVVGEADLIAFVKDQLGSYKAPKTVTFVAELPTSSVGKVLRKDVRAKYWADSGRKVN